MEQLRNIAGMFIVSVAVLIIISAVEKKAYVQAVTAIRPLALT
jgi:hypothetical protein